MKASEAKATAQACHTDYSSDELKSVMGRIEAAAKKGEYSISLSKCLHPVTIGKLIEDGYKVTQGCARNEDYCAVSWFFC